MSIVEHLTAAQTLRPRASQRELQDLYAKWAAGRLNIHRSRIKSVDFGVIYGGYCETCEYETFGAKVYLNDDSLPREIEDEATTIIAELLRAAAA